MARPKKFNREGVLDKAIPIFWEYGLAGTNVQQLEQATGVNKSGLYSEFESKDVFFTEALRRYLDTGPAQKILNTEPLGWDNVENFLKSAPLYSPDQTGCFSINSTREVAGLPSAAVDLIRNFNDKRLESIARNVAAERPGMPVEVISDLVRTFFSGICIDANLVSDRDVHVRRVENFMGVLRTL